MLDVRNEKLGDDDCVIIKKDFVLEFFLYVQKNLGFAVLSTSREIRTLVLTLKGLRPGPLDDGGSLNVRSSKRP